LIFVGGYLRIFLKRAFEMQGKVNRKKAQKGTRLRQGLRRGRQEDPASSRTTPWRARAPGFVKRLRRGKQVAGY